MTSRNGNMPVATDVNEVNQGRSLRRSGRLQTASELSSAIGNVNANVNGSVSGVIGSRSSKGFGDVGVENHRGSSNGCENLNNRKGLETSITKDGFGNTTTTTTTTTSGRAKIRRVDDNNNGPVSYTHLTLPTKA